MFAKTGDIIGFRSTITGDKACTTTKIIEDLKEFNDKSYLPYFTNSLKCVQGNSVMNSA